jgi:hypothetical protein
MNDRRIVGLNVFFIYLVVVLCCIVFNTFSQTFICSLYIFLFHFGRLLPVYVLEYTM